MDWWIPCASTVQSCTSPDVVVSKSVFGCDAGFFKAALVMQKLKIDVVE